MAEWAGGVVAVLTAAGVFVAGWMSARRKDRNEELASRRQDRAECEQTAIAQYQGLIEELKKNHRADLAELQHRLGRHDLLLDENRKLVDALYDDNADCHANQQLQYQWMRSADAWMRGAAASLREAGKAPPHPPDLPPKPRPRLPRDRAEFEVRSARQKAALVKENDSRVLPPRGEGGKP